MSSALSRKSWALQSFMGLLCKIYWHHITGQSACYCRPFASNGCFILVTWSHFQKEHLDNSEVTENMKPLLMQSAHGSVWKTILYVFPNYSWFIPAIQWHYTKWSEGKKEKLEIKFWKQCLSWDIINSQELRKIWWAPTLHHSSTLFESQLALFSWYCDEFFSSRMHALAFLYHKILCHNISS